MPARRAGESRNSLLRELTMDRRRRWRLWLGLLVVAAIVGLILAIVLPRKLDAPRVQPSAESNDWRDTLAEVQRDRSVPRFAVKEEPLPEPRIALSVFDKQATQREENGLRQRMALSIPSVVQTRQQPTDAGVQASAEPNVLLMRKLSERLKYMQADRNSTAAKQ